MELEYEIRRSSKRKRLTITVERDCSVVVHAPRNTSETKIQEVVDSKRQWIYEKIGHEQKYNALPHPPGKELVSGESALYLGQSYPIEVVEKGLETVVFERGFLIPQNQVNDRKETLREWYMSKGEEMIIPRVERFAKELGVTYSKVKLVDNRFRWGSCTVKNTLNFNWRLIKAPMFVIDYVIIHELAHLIESNHTPRFWNIVRTHVVSEEKARKWLKENGELLEQEI